MSYCWIKAETQVLFKAGVSVFANISSCYRSLFISVPWCQALIEAVYMKTGTTGWERGVQTVSALSTIRQRAECWCSFSLRLNSWRSEVTLRFAGAASVSQGSECAKCLTSHWGWFLFCAKIITTSNKLQLDLSEFCWGWGEINQSVFLMCLCRAGINSILW